MIMNANPRFELLVADIDNTVFDWVSYYSIAFTAMLRKVGRTINVPLEVLCEEAREVLGREKSIEYPFVAQDLPSVIAFYGDDIDRMLAELVEPAREAFNTAALPWLKPYPGVVEALRALRKARPDMPIAALTDAPRYVAMWKLNKLGILSYFDAVYGLEDPRIPVAPHLGRVKVSQEILIKNLQPSNFGYSGMIRILPEDYEKPGPRGLKTVLMDYELDEPREKRRAVLWVGDNLRKDVGLGHVVGVRTAWAEYGATVKPDMLALLRTFSPPLNVHKNANLSPADPNAAKPDVVLSCFADLVSFVTG
jgi:FMN phosphatase YigB (HAD superfamily)